MQLCNRNTFEHQGSYTPVWYCQGRFSTVPSKIWLGSRNAVIQVAGVRIRFEHDLTHIQAYIYPKTKTESIMTGLIQFVVQVRWAITWHFDSPDCNIQTGLDMTRPYIDVRVRPHDSSKFEAEVMRWRKDYAAMELIRFNVFACAPESGFT